MTKQNDIRIYGLAKNFLLDLLQKKQKEYTVLEKHINPKISLSSLKDVYIRLLESGANRERAQGVILAPIGNVKSLSDILFNFNLKKIIAHYESKQNELLNRIIGTFNLNINTNKRGMWPQYCNTIISGAKFLSKFKNYDDFDKFVNFFHRDERARNALPLLLKEEIKGFGLALSCDFLKESGYLMFGKPDVYIKKIFKELNLSSSENDYEILNAIVRIAKNNNVKPYNVDKLFWLIGSGKFYLERNSKTGKMLKLGRKMQAFFDYVNRNYG